MCFGKMSVALIVKMVKLSGKRPELRSFGSKVFCTIQIENALVMKGFQITSHLSLTHKFGFGAGNLG